MNKNRTKTNNDYDRVRREEWKAGSQPEISIKKGKAFVVLEPPYKRKADL